MIYIRFTAVCRALTRFFALNCLLNFDVCIITKITILIVNKNKRYKSYDRIWRSMELSGFKHIQIFGMESTGYVSGADPENWTPPL